MVLRSLSIHRQLPSNRGDIKLASQAFIQMERQVSPPFAIIFQAEHSILAGHLAEALLHHIFGEIPPEVILAISQHDFGWQHNDQAQMNSRNERAPLPFPALSTEETLPSWYASIAHGRSLGVLAYVMISRHFTTLGTADETRAQFIRTETERRAEVESTLGYPASDLNRWIGALGLSDLLSLYLCCGSEETVEFPLAHPADPASANAKKIILRWSNGSPHFSPPLLRRGTSVSLDARVYSGCETDLMPAHLEWYFPEG
jgi:hypothetical protein